MSMTSCETFISVAAIASSAAGGVER